VLFTLEAPQVHSDGHAHAIRALLDGT
jgi:hypothetical protein